MSFSVFYLCSNGLHAAVGKVDTTVINVSLCQNQYLQCEPSALTLAEIRPRRHRTMTA